MAHHFTQRAAYRDLSRADVYGLTDEEAHEELCQARWNSSEIVECPACGHVDKHYKRRKRRQWRCRTCQRCFSVTSGTLFADHKLPLRKLLPAIYEFAVAPKGASANEESGALGVAVMTAFHNFSKLREVTLDTQDKTPLKGVVQVDGGHFCGKPRKANRRTKATGDRINSRLLSRKQSIIPAKTNQDLEPWNIEKLKNRRVVIVLRELHPLAGGKNGAVRTITQITKLENSESVVPILSKCIAPGTIVQTDGGHAYRMMDHSKFEHQPVIHAQEYSTEDGWNNNQAESFFGRLRRAEFGVYHGMRHQYMDMYSAETAWREDNRRKSRSEKFRDLIKKAMQHGHSRSFRGYKQGHRRNPDEALKLG